jgi:MerR family transcriptional regulator, light-induced transcriptional regulator
VLTLRGRVLTKDAHVAVGTEMNEQGPNAGSRYVSTAQVAEALGVGITTVKRWVDQGILPAHKTAGGHRKILLSDVVRVVREGDFPHLDLGRLGLPQLGQELPDSATMSTAMLFALKRGEAEDLRTLLQRAYRSGMEVETLADAVVAPAMRRLGHDWAEGRVDVWQEHRGTQLCAAALYEIRAALENRADGKKPLAIGGGPEGDPYLLANLLAEMALRGLGWNVVNLGPNTPLRSFRAALVRTRPRLLWLSASHLVDPASFLEQYRELYQAALRMGTAVAVGGQALTADLRAQMPYTTFGDGLTHLVAFARSLHPKARRPRRGRPPGT